MNCILRCVDFQGKTAHVIIKTAVKLRQKYVHFLRRDQQSGFRPSRAQFVILLSTARVALHLALKKQNNLHKCVSFTTSYLLDLK